MLINFISRIKNLLKSSFPKLLLIYYKIRFVFRSLYNREARDHLKWIIISGDKKGHKKYNLDSGSIFFDIGGYKGEFTDSVFNEFNCSCYIFEPHPDQASYLDKKFSTNEKVEVYNFGLYHTNSKEYLTDDLSSSKITNKETGLFIEFRDIYEVINDLGINKIDLMKINIEGAEYKLLDRIIDTGLINNINHLQIQFHKKDIENPEYKREKAISKLSETHNNIWSYYYVWERWSNKNLDKN